MKNMKRILSITLAFLLIFCGNIFAAIVSDDDGKAFITRAEFEAMLAPLDMKVSEMISGIDATIDNSITTYVAGLAGSDVENGNVIKY